MDERLKFSKSLSLRTLSFVITIIVFSHYFDEGLSIEHCGLLVSATICNIKFCLVLSPLCPGGRTGGGEWRASV